MSEARKTLDERLAKGEISLEEHAKLVSAIHAHNAPGASPSSAAKSINIAKFWWVIPIILIVLWISSMKNNLVIENISSNSPLFADTTVTAVVYNNGSAREHSYHIEKGSSKSPHCNGRFFIGANERRTLRFQCAALTGYTGRFRFVRNTKN